MAYGIVHQFAGGTQDQYEASVAVVHPSDGSLPEGQLFHAAGPSSNGWTVVVVYDTQENYERFRDGVLDGQDGGDRRWLHGAARGVDVQGLHPGDRVGSPQEPDLDLPTSTLCTGVP